MSEIDGLNSRARYRRLAQECLETARTIQNTEARATLLEMAQIWQRLAAPNGTITASTAFHKLWSVQ
jgi:hypothetical protein